MSIPHDFDKHARKRCLIKKSSLRIEQCCIKHRVFVLGTRSEDHYVYDGSGSNEIYYPMSDHAGSVRGFVDAEGRLWSSTDTMRLGKWLR